MSIKVEPFAGRVVIIPDPAVKVTKGGIELPPQAQDAPRVGTVVAVGSGVPDTYGGTIPMQTKIGDRVVYSDYGKTEVRVAGDSTTYYVVKEGDLIAKLVEIEDITDNG